MLVKLALCFALLASVAQAELRRIQIDGFGDDWLGAAQSFVDPAADAAAIDLRGMSIANDEHNLVLFFELGAELIQQNSNNLRLYLDTDHNSATGLSAEGIGAELVWYFGSRSGTAYNSSGQGTSVAHDDLGLRILPTHGSDHFELALALDAAPGGQNLFSGNSLRFVLLENGGDRFPDAGSHSFSLTQGTLPEILCTPFTRQENTDLRLLSWNTLHASIFDSGPQAAYNRILDALQPDIIAFQEIWDESAAEVVAVMNQLRPGTNWQGAKETSGNVLVSRWQIIDSSVIESGYRNTAHLLDASASSVGGLVGVINVHMRCCSADQHRQNEADSIINYLRRVRGGVDFPLIPANTPFVLLGDFNLVGLEQQLLTLLSGDIIDEGQFGPDSAPDWDGSPLADLISPHCGSPDVYTWYNANSSYAPGRLDYVLYTGSVLELGNHGTLWTATLPATVLNQYGLLQGDAALASDHIPRFVDFRAPGIAATEAELLYLPGSDELALSWLPVSGASSYRIHRSADPQFLPAAWNLLQSSTDTTVLLPAESAGQAWFYRVVVSRD